MSLKTLTVAVAVLGLSTVLSAATEPFLGVWEFNAAKSSVMRGTPPKIEAIVNIEEPGGFRSMLSVVGEKTTGVEIHHYKFDGNFHQTEGSDPRELSFKRVDPNTIEQETRRSGKVTVHRRLEISKDGKTLTLTASGTSGSGVPYTNDTRVYDRK